MTHLSRLAGRTDRPLARLCGQLSLGLLLALPTVAVAQNIAVVNGRPIPKERADLFIKELQRQGQQPTSELATLVRQELVDREILVQEAERRGIPAQPMARFQLETSRQQILIQALVQDELGRNPVTDADIRKEFDRLAATQGKEYRVRHILVETEAAAAALIDRLKKGEKFEVLAKQSIDPGSATRGGDLDWASPQTYVKPFADAIVAMKKGELSAKPVQSQFGWHVIRLDDTRETPMPKFEEVKDQLAESMQRRRLTEFQERLKAKAKIQ